MCYLVQPLLLYVENPRESAHFYEKLLKKAPVEKSETFALFVLGEKTLLGLWKKEDVLPSVSKDVGGSEVCFSVATNTEVDDMFRAWTEEDVIVVQDPTTMDFGYTFTALDPDGHRIRVASICENPV